MNILVLGAGGMAGHVVSYYLREQGHQVDTLSASNKLDEKTVLLDVTNQTVFQAYLDSHQYDAVINCIGLLIQPSEERKDLAVQLNSYLPHYLEAYYKNHPTKLIHLSTDCVFSGHNPPYREDSWPDGTLFYDRSKALGEVINDKDLTFRMSIIGPDMQQKGVGLFNWFMAQHGDINGFATALWNGITTIELAHAILAALEQNLTGLYHLVPSQNISKYELLKLFKDVLQKNDVDIHKQSPQTVDKTLVNTRTDFDYEVPDYVTQITDMKDWIEKHNDLYAHYQGHHG